MSAKILGLFLSFIIAALSAAGAHPRSALLPPHRVPNIIVPSQVASIVSSQAVDGATSQPPSSAAVPSASVTGPDDHGCDIGYVAPFYRAYSPVDMDHLYTTDPDEMKNATTSGGYVYQGVAGLVFRLPTISTVPLYRAYSAAVTEHYYLINQQEMDDAIKTWGFIDQGTAAYVYAKQICGSVPLYYAWNDQEADSLYTTNETELDIALQNGYEDMGITCYVLPEL